MQTLTERVFKLAPPYGVFDETVIENLFPTHSDGARRAVAHRAVRQGEVLRLKPGLFLLAEPYQRERPHPFMLSGLLYSPAHISMESALAFHGLIPERVVEVAAVTTRRSNVLRTPVGRFSYTRVPMDIPRAGVRAVEVAPQSWAFVASPLRAIADLVYIRKKVTWRRHGLPWLTGSLRIELEDLREHGLSELHEILDEMLTGARDRRTARFMRALGREMTHEGDREGIGRGSGGDREGIA